MQYKTMVLELMKQRPALWERLRRKRKIMRALAIYANDLKARHEAWKSQLAQARPASHPHQLASEALEIALQELEAFLGPVPAREASEPPSPDGARTPLRGRNPG